MYVHLYFFAFVSSSVEVQCTGGCTCAFGPGGCAAGAVRYAKMLSSILRHAEVISYVYIYKLFVQLSGLQCSTPRRGLWQVYVRLCVSRACTSAAVQVYVQCLHLQLCLQVQKLRRCKRVYIDI